MSGLFPQMPVIPAPERTTPVCEWVMPKSVLPRRDYCRICTALPPGRPDCISVSTLYDDEGVERCVAAVYGDHAYVIHYAFEPDGRG